MDLHTALLLGAYGFTAASWAWIWKELRDNRSERLLQIEEVKDMLETLIKAFSRQEGVQEGQGHEARILRLEQHCREFLGRYPYSASSGG